MLSWIQYAVLIELTKHATRRYSELKPQDIEGNVFMYHLKGLLKEGLVEKEDKKYRLSSKGLQFAGTLSLATGKTRQQPKILTAIIAKNEIGHYLFSRWHRQPNIGKVSFLHGMLHFGESIETAATRELAEKAGMEAELSYRGCVWVRGMNGTTVDRHMLVQLFEARDMRPGREKEQRPTVSEAFWAPLESIAKTDFVPGFYEIAQLAKAHPQETLFEDITVLVH